MLPVLKFDVAAPRVTLPPDVPPPAREPIFWVLPAVVALKLRRAVEEFASVTSELADNVLFAPEANVPLVIVVGPK